MRKRKWSRREMLGASVGSMAGALLADPLRAAPPAVSAVTPELIEAARKEGKVSYYAAIELNVAERLGKFFEAKYPGISVRIERSGGRCGQRHRDDTAQGECPQRKARAGSQDAPAKRSLTDRAGVHCPTQHAAWLLRPEAGCAHRWDRHARASRSAQRAEDRHAEVVSPSSPLASCVVFQALDRWPGAA